MVFALSQAIVITNPQSDQPCRRDWGENHETWSFKWISVHTEIALLAAVGVRQRWMDNYKWGITLIFLLNLQRAQSNVKMNYKQRDSSCSFDIAISWVRPLTTTLASLFSICKSCPLASWIRQTLYTLLSILGNCPKFCWKNHANYFHNWECVTLDIWGFIFSTPL